MHFLYLRPFLTSAARGEGYSNLGWSKVLWRKNNSVANPLAGKFQNIKGPNCISTSNAKNWIYILETRFVSADCWVGAQWVTNFGQCIFAHLLSPGNFAVEVNGRQFYCCKPDDYFSLSPLSVSSVKRKTVDCIGVYVMLPRLLLLVIAILFVGYYAVLKCTQ